MSMNAERAFENQEALLEALKSEYKQGKGHIEFSGAYVTPDVAHIGGDKQTANELASAVWETTKRRWRSKDSRDTKQGIVTKWFCCQDSGHRDQPKKSQKEGIQNRDKMPMQLFDCQSVMRIRVKHLSGNERKIHVHLIHCATHPAYYDIDIPLDALEVIKNSLWSKPGDIAQNIRTTKPDWARIKTYQVRHTWKKLCQDKWRICDDQLESAKKLLERHESTVEMLCLDEIEGVVALGFGLRCVGERLEDVVEVGVV